MLPTELAEQWGQ